MYIMHTERKMLIVTFVSWVNNQTNKLDLIIKGYRY
jgi:hypothetical protein